MTVDATNSPATVATPEIGAFDPFAMPTQETVKPIVCNGLEFRPVIGANGFKGAYQSALRYIDEHGRQSVFGLIGFFPATCEYITPKRLKADGTVASRGGTKMSFATGPFVHCTGARIMGANGGCSDPLATSKSPQETIQG